MGIEARHKNGNLYYYRKKRKGDRVVSEYVGGGELVVLAERQAERKRAEREAVKARQRAEQMSMAEIDRQLDEFSEMVDAMMKAELLTLGYPSAQATMAAQTIKESDAARL
jgi:hypothetical protein